MTTVSNTRILLPLYIYPDPGAWNPLYAALEKYPTLHFVIVINPNSGPGEAPWWPNTDYVREILRLKAYRNVTLVGYVRATYCNRRISDVLEDIETYASRAVELSHALQGIFIDETVNLYTKAVKGYLDDIDRKVHSTKALGANPLSIHNPGTAVNAGLATPGPDITVVVETSYAQFVTKDYQAWLQTSPYGRSQSCYMLHSVPAEQVERLTKSLKYRAQYVFVTSASAEFYNQWADSWQGFVATVAES
ncbi:hypothetical protein NX059_000684 [Plenodomus lindquistii]|nr:hypothetical protein NX059_000684 [Plenodomus lindquistii]